MMIKEFRGRHLSAREQPTGIGNGWKASKQMAVGKKELIKCGRDMVVCISKALGLYIFKEAESEDFCEKYFCDFVISFQERHFISGNRPLVKSPKQSLILCK